MIKFRGGTNRTSSGVQPSLNQ